MIMGEQGNPAFSQPLLKRSVDMIDVDPLADI